MRAFCVIFLLFSAISLCFADRNVCKGHHHHYKFLLINNLYYLAFFIFKFKVILVVGTIWALAFFFGKIFTVFMNKDNKRQVVYSGSPHHYLDKSFESPSYFSSPPQHFEQPPRKIYGNPVNNFKDSYKTLPVNIGRSYLSSDSTPLENLKIFFDTINKMNLTEVVFKEMKVKTTACKQKFVCEADFNVKQSDIVKTVFDLFIDDCYKKYRSKESILYIEDCAKLNPTCPDKVIQMKEDT